MSATPGSSKKPWEHAKASGSETDALAARFVSSLDYDKRLYKHDIRGSIAHARMLQHVKLITADELAEIERGLTEIEQEIDAQGDAWPGWKTELEDVHMCIEAALIEKTGDAGRKLHTGRSRNDQVALDIKLWIGQARDEIDQRIRSLIRAFCDLSEVYGEVVIPSYTHLQRAQPIVVGGELMAWVCALQRASDRLVLTRWPDDESPLGSGAIAGSSLPLDSHMTAALTELKHPTDNSIDATANRDVAIDLVYAITMTSMTLSRWAEQWIIYASTEFGFITLHDRYTTGSSMMPQKQNPDMLELIRGKTGGVYGNLIALLTVIKGLPIGYNRDLQEDKRHVFAAYDTVCDCLDMATRIVRTTRFNKERIAATLDKGYLDATSLAEYLVTRGVPFRTAHQMVGQLVQQCEAEGLGELRKLTLEQFNAICGADVCGGDVYDWLGAENVVKRYQTAGNAGVSGFEQQLAEWKKRLTPTD